jgi:phosphoglycolate phosphatase
MIGAVAAGVYPVGVLTGPCDEAQLREAGAQLVLPDLTGFADWFGARIA